MSQSGSLMLVNLSSSGCVFEIEAPMADPSVELIQRVRDGDATAFDDLITRHGRALRRHLERYVAPADADDLLQELWLRVWQRAEQWDGRGRLLGWMLTIATNLALNHLRSRRPTVPFAEEQTDDAGERPAHCSEAMVHGPEEQVLWREEIQRIRSAMDLLPSEKQDVLRLIRMEGRSLREAAEMLGVPVGTIKSRLHHAHRQLMETLEEE
jgi:RNA polymerase sigma-70 factor, ECF subfamily